MASSIWHDAVNRNDHATMKACKSTPYEMTLLVLFRNQVYQTCFVIMETRMKVAAVRLPLLIFCDGNALPRNHELLRLGLAVSFYVLISFSV